VIIEATPASQALRGEVEGLWPRLEQLSTDGFTEEQRAAAIALLGSLEQNLRKAITEQAG
jgi:DNA-binding MarR family transcriptional regulator